MAILKHSQTPRPSFLWQGLLIVLPGAALAAFGLAALREDRLLIRQEASEQARGVAAEAARVVLPAALQVTPPAATDIRDGLSLPTQPTNDVILSYASRSPGWVVSLIAPNGALLFPPPDGPPALVSNTLAPVLDRAGQAVWNEAQAADFLGNHAAEAIAAYERFLTGNPPPEFAAQAIYRLGLFSARSGLAHAARDRFERVRREFPDALSETGVPLAFYAGCQLIELPGDSARNAETRGQLLDGTCAQAVLRFPVLAPAILENLDRDGSPDQAQVKLWRRVFQAHQRARSIQAALRRALGKELPSDAAAPTPRWIDLDSNEPWLLIPVPSGSNVWWMALPHASAVHWVETALHGFALPNYLALRVRLAGKPIPGPQGEELAAAAIAGSTTLPATEVSVVLTDPQLLFRRQRSRTYWFGALIALSSVTMLIGLMAARRSFRYQLALNEMKSNFVSSVSHELRAPIASVRLMAEELTDDPEGDPKKLRGYHSFIVQECRRLSGVIENVLDFSRHEQGRKRYHFEPTDLHGLIEATANLMRAYAKDKQIAITTRLPEEPVEIEADWPALQQVLVNLVDNSIKYSPAGSTVTLGMDSGPKIGPRAPRSNSPVWRRFIATVRRGNSPLATEVVRLWVEDQGRGIPAEEQQKIFERFYRLGSELRRESQGVGLGLAIVKLVTEAHGGRVSVRSALNQGSRFTIELPLLQRPSANSPN